MCRRAQNRPRSKRHPCDRVQKRALLVRWHLVRPAFCPSSFQPCRQLRPLTLLSLPSPTVRPLRAITISPAASGFSRIGLGHQSQLPALARVNSKRGAGQRHRHHRLLAAHRAPSPSLTQAADPDETSACSPELSPRGAVLQNLARPYVDHPARPASHLELTEKPGKLLIRCRTAGVSATCNTWT